MAKSIIVTRWSKTRDMYYEGTIDGANSFTPKRNDAVVFQSKRKAGEHAILHGMIGTGYWIEPANKELTP